MNVAYSRTSAERARGDADVELRLLDSRSLRRDARRVGLDLRRHAMDSFMNGTRTICESDVDLAGRRGERPRGQRRGSLPPPCDLLVCGRTFAQRAPGLHGRKHGAFRRRDVGEAGVGWASAGATSGASALRARWPVTRAPAATRTGRSGA